MQPFPHHNDASYKIWSRLASWPERYSSFIWIMKERRNDRRTGQIQYSPTFSKWGYNDASYKIWSWLANWPEIFKFHLNYDGMTGQIQYSPPPLFQSGAIIILRPSETFLCQYQMDQQLIWKVLNQSMNLVKNIPFIFCCILQLDYLTIVTLWQFSTIYIDTLHLVCKEIT